MEVVETNSKRNQIFKILKIVCLLFFLGSNSIPKTLTLTTRVAYCPHTTWGGWGSVGIWKHSSLILLKFIV
jgi:hypothetical protein